MTGAATTTTSGLAEMLAAHEWTWRAVTPQRIALACKCGDELLPPQSSAVATLDDHRAHVEAAVLAWLGERLDEVESLRAKVAGVEALAASWAVADGEPATGADLTALTIANRHGRVLLDILTTPDPTERVRGEGGGRRG